MTERLWVMAMRTSNFAGSISHVSAGEQLFRTKEECQHEIDNMKGWIGMGDRKKYFPLPLLAPK